MASAKEGSHSLIEELYRISVPRLRAHLCRRRWFQDPEDLINEAFARLLTYMQEDKEVRNPEAFLLKVVNNLGVDRHRRARADQYMDEPIEDLNLPSQDPTPEEQVAAYQRGEKIRNLLDEKLTPLTRDIYFRSRYGGFTYEEIANFYRLTVKQVEKRIARAMVLLWEQRQREKQG